MNERRTITVYSIADTRSQIWISAIEHAAVGQGWKVRRHDISASLADHIIFKDLPRDRRVPLDEPYILVMDMFNYRISIGSPTMPEPHIASIENVIEDAAAVVDTNDDSTVLPELGMVQVRSDRSVVSGTEPQPADDDGYAAKYLEDGSTSDRFVWNAEGFSTSSVDRPVRHIDRDEWIKLEGRQRVIVFGPYVKLPPGLWRAVFRFAVDTEGLKLPLNFHWGNSSASSGSTHTLTKSGCYEVVLEAALSDALPVEFRVFPQHAMFGGALQVLRCEVSLISLD